jgi:hypothetical protein
MKNHTNTLIVLIYRFDAFIGNLAGRIVNRSINSNEITSFKNVLEQQHIDVLKRMPKEQTNDLIGYYNYLKVTHDGVCEILKSIKNELDAREVTAS